MAIVHEAILSLDTAVGYEGRFAHGAGATNVGVDVVSVSSPSPPAFHAGTNCMNFGEGKTLADASLPSELFTVDTATTYNKDTFYIRFSSIEDLDSHATTEVEFLIAENTTEEWKLVVYATGVGTHGVKLVHSNSMGTTTTVTTSTPFSNNTWHRITIVWQHANAGLVKVYIDNTQHLSTSLDMLNTNGDAGTVRYRFAGQVDGSAPNPLHTETYMWGFLHERGHTTTGNSVEYGIIPLRPYEKRGDVPDCDESGNIPGDTLLSGGGEDIADDTSSVAILRSHPSGLNDKGMAWATDKLQGLSGPNGYFKSSAVGLACLWQIWYDAPSKGSDNETLIFGNMRLGSPDTYDVDTVNIPRGADLKASIINEVGADKFPDIEKEFAVVGMGTKTVVNNRSASLEEAWVDYVFLFDVTEVVSRLTLNGSMTLNGSTTLCA